MILLRMFLLILFTTSLGVTSGAFELFLQDETSQHTEDRISHHAGTNQLPAPAKIAESETEEFEKLDDSGTEATAGGQFHGLVIRISKHSILCCDAYSQRAGEESHFCLPPPDFS